MILLHLGLVYEIPYRKVIGYGQTESAPPIPTGKQTNPTVDAEKIALELLKKVGLMTIAGTKNLSFVR